MSGIVRAFRRRADAPPPKIRRHEPTAPVPVVHINPFAGGIKWDGRMHGGPPWRGVCIAGLHAGTHYFPRSHRVIAVTGVFGNVGNRPGLLAQPCKRKVRHLCRLFAYGQLLPFWWLACDLPEHMQNAGVIETLDDQGWVIKTEHVAMPEEGASLEAPPEPPTLPERVPTPPALPPGPAPRKGRWASSL